MQQEDLKEYVDGLDRLMEKHAKELQDLLGIIFDDIIDSYDVLIQQRKACIDKYIRITSILLQDESDISKPIKSLLEKQHDDIAKFEQEVAPINEFKKVMLSDSIPSEKESDELMDMIKNI